MRVLDVGCGPGRHSLALARRGIEVVGVDHIAEFVRLARDAAAADGLSAHLRGARRARPRRPTASSTPRSACARAASACSADATRPTCSAGSPRTLRPGGALAVSAFSAAFAVRFLEAGEDFDPATGVLHERRHGAWTRTATRATFDLWTTCFTARELELLARGAGLDVDRGARRHAGRVPRAAADARPPELLLLARRDRPARLSEMRARPVACTFGLDRGPSPAPAGQPAALSSIRSPRSRSCRIRT